MNKNLFFAAVMTMITAAGFAQAKGNIEGGFGIGYNMSTVSSSYDSADTGAGLNLAGSIDYYFNDRWSIKGKLIYDQKGFNNGIITDIDTGTEYFTDYNLNYMTIPVMAGWHFAPKRNWYLNFGPYVGFLVDAKETTFDTDISDAISATDFGLAFGIGVKIPVSQKIRLFFEYDGQSGLSNIFEQETGEDVYNSRSSFNFGINFLMK